MEYPPRSFGIQSVAGGGGIGYAIIMTDASTASCADRPFEGQDTF